MKLTEPIVFVRLEFGLPGQTRQVDSTASAKDLGADAKRLRAHAKLFTSSAFTAITAFRIECKRRLLRLAISAPSCFRGSYVLPRKLLAQAEEELEADKKQDEGLVDTFIRTAYGRERDLAERELGSAFDADDYPPPTEAKRDFRMAWSYFTLDVPEDLPPLIREQEAAKLREQIEEVATECRLALRQGMAALVEHLVERLKPTADGKRQRLAATTVEKLRDFLETLEARDLTSDDDLRALAAKARDVLGTESVETMRDEAPTADRIRNGLGQVSKELDGLVKKTGQRKFNLED